MVTLLALVLLTTPGQPDVCEIVRDELASVSPITPADLDTVTDLLVLFRKCYVPATTTTTTTTVETWNQRTVWGANVEQWRPLIAGHFEPEDVDTAMCIIHHESRGDPTADNPRSTARGLWQFLQWAWDWVADELDGPSYASGAPDSPEISTYYARWLRDNIGWTAWNPYKDGRCR